MASQAVATRQENQFALLERQLATRATEFAKALPSHISPDKFQRTVLTAVQTNPGLLDADRSSLISACYKAAADALLPDGREAALVEFKTRVRNPQTNEFEDARLVQYMPMVFGLRKKILQSGEIKAIKANVVYREEFEQGLFVYEEGSEGFIRHRPSLTIEPKDEHIIAAYSIATLEDGSIDFLVMRRNEIDKIRQTSQTGATGRTVKWGKDKGKTIESKGPWVDWFSEMAKKTVLRRHSKTLPMSGDIIDVEAREIELEAASVDNVLHSRPEPVALPMRAETGAINHDPETGEIIDGQAEEQGDVQQPKRERKKKRDQPEQAEKEGGGAPQQAEATGEGTHPARAAADQIMLEVADIDSTMNLNSLKSRVAKDVAAMPEEIAAEVNKAIADKETEIRTPTDKPA